MPQLDLDSVLCGGGHDSVVALECAISDSDNEEESETDANGPYAPAESLRLRIGEDIDWGDVGAVLDRDDSTKGAANPKSAARKSAAAARSSCAAAGEPKAVAVVIGGLPAAGKVAREHGRRRSCRLGRAREFARAAPASPKVSCLGGVQSQPKLEITEAGRRRWWAWCIAAGIHVGGGRGGSACTQAAEVEAQPPAARCAACGSGTWPAKA